MDLRRRQQAVTVSACTVSCLASVVSSVSYWLCYSDEESPTPARDALSWAVIAAGFALLVIVVAVLVFTLAGMCSRAVLPSKNGLRSTS